MVDGTQFGGLSANEQAMFFAESVASDRVASESMMGLFIASLQKPGAVNGFLNSLEVVPTGPASLGVDIKTGAAFVGPAADELAAYLHNLIEALNFPTADVTDGRIDLVGLSLKRAVGNRHVGLISITGTPDPSPARPALGHVQDKDDFFLELAEIQVDQNETTIQAGDITDTRTFANARGTTTRRSMWFPASSLKPPVGAAGPSADEFEGSGIWDTNTLQFDQATDESAFGSLILPPEWDGLLLSATVHWIGGGSAGNVIWALDALGVVDQENLGTAMTEIGTVTDARTSTNHLQVSSPIVWDGSTPALVAGDLLQFGLRRDANAGGDTISADVEFVGVLIEFDTNTP